MSHFVFIQFLVLLYVDAFPSKIEESPGYHLLCTDGSPAINERLHACCGEKKPYDYCILCWHLFPIHGYEENCTIRCNGTVSNAKVRAKGGVCLPLQPEKLVIKSHEKKGKEEAAAASRYHGGGCPHLRKMKGL